MDRIWKFWLTVGITIMAIGVIFIAVQFTGNIMLAGHVDKEVFFGQYDTIYRTGEDTLSTVKEVERVRDLPLGSVVIKRQSDDSLFKVLVLPYQEIEVGTTVTLSRISYYRNNWNIETVTIVNTE